MLDLPNVTLITVAGVNAAKSLKALQFSMEGINFGEAKIITPENVYSKKIKTVNIEPINYENYNKFIVYELHKHINTDYLLLIQDDGFVVNSDSWRDEFFDYDYIGAPWPLPNDSFSYRDPLGNLIRVGNGGFSFRSKKLCSIASDLELPWKSYYGYFNEDGFITCHNRAIYEEQGCKYAPVSVAKYFSHECYIPELEGIKPFGFHGRGSKYMELLERYNYDETQ